MSLEEKTDFPPIDLKELGKIIQIRRKQMKLNQGDFAESMGVTQSYISLIENNHKPLNSLSLLKNISHV